MMESAIHWQSFFENWPESMPRRGIIITTYQESIPFVDFLLSRGILLVERDKPDSAGARKVMLVYESIAAVKLTDTLDLDRFLEMGFHRPQ